MKDTKYPDYAYGHSLYPEKCESARARELILGNSAHFRLWRDNQYILAKYRRLNLTPIDSNSLSSRSPEPDVYTRLNNRIAKARLQLSTFPIINNLLLHDQDYDE